MTYTHIYASSFSELLLCGSPVPYLHREYTACVALDTYEHFSPKGQTGWCPLCVERVPMAQLAETEL